MPESLPAQIGRFHVQSELGRGGFGRVFKAFDPTVSRLVAIKVLTAGGRDVLTRFRNEATVAGNLRHENIVTVYEYGEYEDKPFLAMEFLDGEDLHHVISSKKSLSLLQKCQIMSQVAEGLYCAHSNGVVHRDVKPSNVMVLADSRVKIMDFGIARVIRDSEATRLTQEGYMLGTLLYMAPEQMAGNETDALCDIFAYGVIYYELLTGRHPFASADARALMYKVSFEEPPPLATLMSDFPDGLQRVLSRILHKDRELRYQSLKEVQFDIGPVLIELRQKEAAQLLGKAQELFEAGQMEPAQAVVLEILGLDPSDKVARALWENLQKQLRQRTLRPRIEALLKRGEERLSQRHFTDALQSLEAAQRLDPDNVEVQGRLQLCRGLIDHAKRAAALLVEARADFERQDFSGAYKAATEALRHDPQYEDATAFLKRVQEAIEHRERERRVEDAIVKVEALLALHSYDEALAVLTGLGPEAANPKVARLLEWVHTEQADYERKQRLHNEMAVSTDLLRDNRFDEAVGKLEVLLAEFPDNAEVGQLLSYAQRELAGQQRLRAVEKAVAEVTALAEAHEFDRALEAANQALKRYPGEFALIRLLGNTVAAKADWECLQAVQETLARCAQLRSQKRLAEAVQAVEAALREYRGETRLLDLLRDLEGELAAERRSKAIQSVCAEARKLLDRGQPDKAAQALRQAQIEFPHEPALGELLERAQRELREQERVRALETIGRDAAAYLKAKNFAAALDVLRSGLEAWPGEAALLQQQETARAAKAAFERAQAIQDIVRRAQALAVENQFLEAVGLVEEALRQYPGESSLTRLNQQLEAQWEQAERREAIRKVTDEARSLVSADRLEEAIRLLEDNLRVYPAEAGLQALLAAAQQELRVRERAAAIEELVADARAATAAQQFDSALAALDRGLAQYAAEPALERERDRVRQAKAAFDRRKAVGEAVRQATEWAGQKRYAEALELVTRSLKEFDNEPALRDVQRTVEAGWQEHQRREAVAKAAADAGALLDNGQLDAALKFLQDACARFPGEAELDRLSARARQESEARQRGLAIAKAADEVRALAAQKNFDRAQQALTKALDTWPEEAVLRTLRDAVQTDRTAWERDQAIRKATLECERLAGEGKFDDALRIAAQAQEQFAGVPALAELSRRLEREREQKRRGDAVAAAAAGARALLQKGQLEEAARALGDARRQYPGEASLESLAKQAEQELQARKKRDEIARAAERMLSEGRLEDAIASLQQALTSFSGDASLGVLLSRAQSELEARRHTEAVAKAAADCRAMMDTHAFDGALSLLDRQLKIWPEEKSLLDLRQSALAAKAAWQREKALQDRIQSLEKLARENRLAQGLDAAERALREFPDSPRLAELRQQFHERKLLQDAAGLIDQGRPAEALSLLQQVAQAAPEFQALAERAQAALDAQERAAAIEKLAAEARASVSAGDLEGALAVLYEGLQEYPEATDLVEIRQATIKALDAARRQRALDEAIGLLESEERENHLAEALEFAEQALGEFGKEPTLLKARQRLQTKLREEEERQNRQRDIDQLHRLEAEARQVSGPSHAIEILETARAIKARHPESSEVQTAAAIPLEQVEAIQQAQRALAAGNFGAALDVCRKQLARYPGYAAFTALQAEAERAQKGALVADLQRRAAAEANLETRAGLLEQGLRQAPSDRWMESELRATRNKLALAQSTAEKAQALEDAGQWDEALEQWNSLAALYRGFPGLDTAIERVRRKREEALAAAVTRWVERIEAQLQSGDVGRTAELLSQAEAECPGSPRWRELAQRLEQVKQGKARVRDQLARGQAECEKGRYQEAQATLREVFTLEYADAAARKTALDTLAKYAKAAVSKDWRAAEALAKQARALDPTFAPPADLDSAIADRKKEEIVSECLSQAEQRRKAADPLGALVEIERGLLGYPDDSRLKRLRQTLSGQAREFKEKIYRELEQMRHTAQAAADPTPLEVLRTRALAIAAEHQDAEIQAKAGAAASDLTSRIETLRTAQRNARLAILRKRMLMAGAGATVLLAAVFGARVLLRSPELIPLSVTSSPPGATIKAGQETCSSPACQFKLKPGAYTIEAHLDGYRPVTQPVTLDAAHHEPVTLALEALRPQVHISTNFASGTVTLDGKSAGALSNGQLTLPDVAFGKHRLAVTSPDGQAKLAFETAAGRLAVVTEKVQATDADAIVVSNLGGNARLECNCGNQKVTVDGKPAGEMSANGLDLHDLAEGNKTVKLGERELVVSVRPEPALDVFVTSNRNIGTLVIETNVENPTVLIDNKPYPGAASQGLIRIPLNVAAYSVKLEKNGYRSPAAQTVQVAKGGTEKLVFKLEPMRAALEIRGALPGTQVAVDGKPLGEVPPNGRFTSDVGTGQHSVELSKQGYKPNRIVRRFEPGQTVAISGAEAVLGQDQAAAEEARRKADQAAWDAVNKNDRAALQQYVDQHAGGRFNQDAQTLINKLEQADKQQRTEQQRAEQQKRDEEQRKAAQAEEQRKAAQAELQRKAALDEEQRKKTADAAALRQQQLEAQQRADADRQAVLDVLKRYAAAYNSRDANAVKAVFPDVPKFSLIVESFKIFKSYQLTLVPADPQISGDRATVRCQRTIAVTDEHGKQPPRSDTVSFSLRKTGAQWAIASMQ